MYPRMFFAIATLLALTILSGCVPDSDLDRVSGNGRDDANNLTPIAEDELPAPPELEVRVLGVDIHRTGGRVAAEIAVAGAPGDDMRLGEIARVEWSDGEVFDAVPRMAEGIIIESRRSDPDENLVPVRVYLSSVTRRLGTDENARITPDEIVTEWGTFPVLDIQRVNRPPGWRVDFQAAGQRWVTDGHVWHEGRVREFEGEDVSFNEEFRPVSGSIRFDHRIEDLAAELPLDAEVDVRIAVPEMTIDL